MTASQRRKAIIDLLCMRKFETRENLAFEFGVSLRTIDYGILALTTEYPIYTTQGNGERGGRQGRKGRTPEK